jgi:hypothetical protein
VPVTAFVAFCLFAAPRWDANIPMIDGIDTVVKGIVGVADHAGGFYLLHSMPSAAMWAIEIRSMLRRWDFMKKYLEFGSLVYVGKKKMYRVQSRFRGLSDCRSSREIQVGRSNVSDGRKQVSANDRKYSTKV